MEKSKILIIESAEKKHVAEDFSNTSVVHIRNSLIIAQILNADLISHVSQIEAHILNEYDHIICMYASHYMKYKEYIRLIEANPEAKLWWLVNDHDMEDNILLRNAIFGGRRINVICNNPREGYRQWVLNKKMKPIGGVFNDYIDEWHTINLNVLIFNPYIKPVEDKKNAIYYGTFRKWRSEDMKAFNGKYGPYAISTSTKNQQKYLDAGVKPITFVDRLSWKIGDEELSKYKYSIYFEDKHTHDNYAFMANRWYECLMTDVLMFFDEKCIGTIRRSGFHIDPYLIVRDGLEMKEKMAEFDRNKIAYQAQLNESRKLNFPIAQSEWDTVASNLIDIVS